MSISKSKISSSVEVNSDENNSSSSFTGSKTLRDKVIDGLRHSILNGELEAGQKLFESEVAKTFKASRTPVREAFKQLEKEGFIYTKERRGAYVAPIEEKKIKEFYEIKAVLEGYAARVACPKLDADDLEKMSQLNEALESLYKAGDTNSMVKVHNEFHAVFVDACGNTELISLLDKLISEFQRFRITLSHTNSIEESIKQHEEIIKAFKEKDAFKAERLVADNSLEGSRSLIAKHI